jgi:hypothetical protein
LLTGLTITRLLVEPYLTTTAPHLLAGNAPSASSLTSMLLTIPLVTMGDVLLGLATIRAGVFPRGASLLLIGVVINLQLSIHCPTS